MVAYIRPVLDAYEAAGYVRKVDASRDVDLVFADVCKVCDATVTSGEAAVAPTLLPFVGLFLFTLLLK